MGLVYTLQVQQLRIFGAKIKNLQCFQQQRDLKRIFVQHLMTTLHT